MLRPKRYIERLSPARHGGIDYPEIQKLGISPEEVLDFSVCTNPCGPPDGLEKSLTETNWERYPDSESTELKARLAEKLGVAVTNLIVGSGSTELFRLVTTAYLDEGSLVLIIQPTYGEYELSCRIAGAEIITLSGREEDNFYINPLEIAEMIKQHRPSGVFLCNPNNPTGQYMERQDIERILQAAPETLVVLDEAYLAFTDNAWSTVDLIDRDNLLILRSMTKDYALAGLRLGYGIADEKIISILHKVKPPWNVNTVAQRAGTFVLENDEYLEHCQQEVAGAKNYLIENLQRLGLAVLPSQTNFFLVRVGNAAAFRQELLKKGILVRDAASFGLPNYIRLAARPFDECRKLVEAIQGTLA
jgi:histidinol-phosphate aminotransferase